MAMRVLLYGLPGIGKTSSLQHLVETARDRVCIVDTEEGTIGVPKLFSSDTTKVYMPSSWGELDRVVHEFEDQPIIVVDTLDGLVRMARSYVAKQEGKSVISEIEYGRGYQLVKESVFAEISKMDLRASMMVLVGHAMEDNRIVRPVAGYIAGRSVSEDLSHELAGLCHVIAYMPRFGVVVTSQNDDARVMVKSRFQATRGEFNVREFWERVVETLDAYKKIYSMVVQR